MWVNPGLKHINTDLWGRIREYPVVWKQKESSEQNKDENIYLYTETCWAGWWAKACRPCQEVQYNERCLRKQQQTFQLLFYTTRGEHNTNCDILVSGVSMLIFLLTGLFEASLDPLREPAQVTVTVQRVGTESPVNTQLKVKQQLHQRRRYTETDSGGAAPTGGTERWGGWKLLLVWLKGRCHGECWRRETEREKNEY